MKKKTKEAIRQGLHSCDLKVKDDLGCFLRLGQAGTEGRGQAAVDEIYEALIESGVVEPDPEPREFWLRGGGWFFSESEAINSRSLGKVIHVREVIDD